MSDSATTDFVEWVDNVDLEDHEDVYSLYNAVKGRESFGIFDVKPASGGGERWIVKARHVDQPLLLASSAARDAFLKHLTNTFCGEFDMEGWYAFERGIAKD